MTDIPDFRRDQSQVVAAQKLESLGVLVGGIAHDFNNMMSSILASCDLAQEDLAGGCPAYEEVRKIRTVAGRAAEIVRQMMAYAGQETTTPEPADLSGLVGGMLELLKVSISKNATLNVNLKENLPAVQASPAQIRQVVMNLVINASEALGERGGVITITTSESQAEGGDAAGAQGPPAGRCVRLEVSDTGCGVSEEFQSRIYDPFFTTKSAGRGLGLAAVQGIIRAHGGVIKLTSAPGEGARFTVLLPCGEEVSRRGDIEAPGSAGESAISPGHVLIVEDEDTLRMAVSKMLRRRGFSVIEAADGRNAIDLLRARHAVISLMLLDMTLPGTRSTEVFAEARRIRPGIKVILTSAYSRKMVLAAFGGQQTWAFIRKPYQIGALEELLRNVLTRPAEKMRALSAM